MVSNSTAALDLAGGLCSRLGLPTCRIDGATAVDTRQDVVNAFNSAHASVRVGLVCSLGVFRLCTRSRTLMAGVQ